MINKNVCIAFKSDFPVDNVAVLCCPPFRPTPTRARGSKYPDFILSY